MWYGHYYKMKPKWYKQIQSLFLLWGRYSTEIGLISILILIGISIMLLILKL